MVQAANLWDRDDGALARSPDRTGNQRVLGERQVSARSSVIVAVQCEESFQARFVEHNDVIETLSPDCGDKSFRNRVLPRCPRGDEHFVNAPRLGGWPEAVKRMVAIPEGRHPTEMPRVTVEPSRPLLDGP